jgi:hypothetical protein
MTLVSLESGLVFFAESKAYLVETGMEIQTRKPSGTRQLIQESINYKN